MTSTPLPTPAPPVVPRRIGQEPRQLIFRTLLAALAEPGSLQELPRLAPSVPDEPPGPGADLPVVCAPITVLCDLMTGVAPMADDAEAAALVDDLAALTHAPLVPLHEARFVLATAIPEPALVRRLYVGSNARPHTGAILSQQVDVCGPAGNGGPGLRLRLRGPGIKDHTDVRIAGVTESFLTARAQRVAEFPRGFDVVFIDGRGTVVGLPRTTDVEVRP